MWVWRVFWRWSWNLLRRRSRWCAKCAVWCGENKLCGLWLVCCFWGWLSFMSLRNLLWLLVFVLVLVLIFWSIARTRWRLLDKFGSNASSSLCKIKWFLLRWCSCCFKRVDFCFYIWRRSLRSWESDVNCIAFVEARTTFLGRWFVAIDAMVGFIMSVLVCSCWCWVRKMKMLKMLSLFV